MSFISSFQTTAQGIKDKFQENLNQLSVEDRQKAERGISVLKESKTAQALKRTAAVIPKLQPTKPVEEFKKSITIGPKPGGLELRQDLRTFTRKGPVNKFVNTIGASLNQFGFRAAESTANLIKMLNTKGFGNFFPSVGVSGLMTERDKKAQTSINEFSDEMIGFARKKQEELQGEIDYPLVANFTQAGANILLSAGLYAAGHPELAPATLTALETFPTYSEAIDAGKSENEALAITSASAAGTYFFEKAGLDFMFKNMGSKFVSNRLVNALTKFGVGGTGEVIQENLQNAWQSLVRKTTFEGFEGETLSDKVAELFEGWVETSIISFTLGGLVGGVGGDVTFQQTREVETKVDKTINEIAKELDISKEEAGEVFESIREYAQESYGVMKDSLVQVAEDTRGETPVGFGLLGEGETSLETPSVQDFNKYKELADIEFENLDDMKLIREKGVEGEVIGVQNRAWERSMIEPRRRPREIRRSIKEGIKRLETIREDPNIPAARLALLDQVLKDSTTTKLKNASPGTLAQIDRSMQEIIKKGTQDVRVARKAELKKETKKRGEKRRQRRVVKNAPTLMEYDTQTEEARGGFDNQWYQKNKKPPKTPVKDAKESAGHIKKEAGRLLDKVAGTISTRAKNVSPKLKNFLRQFEFDVRKQIDSKIKAVEPMMKATSELSEDEYYEFDLARKNGDVKKQKEIAEKNGFTKELEKARSTLDLIYTDMKEVGYDIGYVEGYFPRMVRDAKGFEKHIRKTVGSEEWGIIESTIRAKLAESNKPSFSADERAHIINTLVRGYGKDGISLSKTGAMKTRTIDVIDAEMNKFYMDSNAALSHYIRINSEAIEARKLFGKGIKGDAGDLSETIGYFVNKNLKTIDNPDGFINPIDEQEVVSILKARFNPEGIKNGFVATYRAVSYIDTMGQISSTITQFGDIAFSAYKSGVLRSLINYKRAIQGKGLKKSDVYIDSIAAEWDDPSKIAGAVNKTFRLTGLEKVDGLGKSTLIQSAWDRMQSESKKNPAKLRKDLDRVFDGTTFRDTGEAVFNDIVNGNLTENVKYVLFSELLDMQPIALSELPEGYLKGGDMRILYMLKTFTLKMMDVFRNEAFSKMADPDNRVKVEGFINLLHLSALLMAANMAADKLKDFIYRRTTDVADLVVDNLFRLAGVSKFYVWEARREGGATALLKFVLPPAKLLNALIKDIFFKGRVPFLHPESEAIKSIPIVGSFYYWWFVKKAKAKAKKGKTTHKRS